MRTSKQIKGLYETLKEGDKVTVTEPQEAYSPHHGVYFNPGDVGIVGKVHVASVRYSRKYKLYGDEMVCIDFGMECLWNSGHVVYQHRCSARYQEIKLLTEG